MWGCNESALLHLRLELSVSSGARSRISSNPSNVVISYSVVSSSFGEELTKIALALRNRVRLCPKQRFRLVGVGLSNFCKPDDALAQPPFFE